jgi:hypothetical protein
VVVGLSGCQGLLAPFAQKPAHSAYLPVDFRKLTSAASVEEWSYKYVKTDWTFMPTTASVLPGGYSRARYVAFSAFGPTLSRELILEADLIQKRQE